jgi:predicted transposase/invertase (TIGR01784 family)
MPELAGAPIGLSILYLIRQSEDLAPTAARELISRVKAEIKDEALAADLVQLIETIIIYKLPRLSREEIQKMLQVQDIRETRVYQEAKEEGLQEGLEKGMAIAISRMAGKQMSTAQIAAILDLDEEVVRRALAKANGN